MKRATTRWIRTPLAALLLAGTGVIAVSPPVVAAYPASCQETFPAGVPAGFTAPPQSTTSHGIPVDIAGEVADVDVTIFADGIDSAMFTFGPANDFSLHAVDLASVGGNADFDGVTFDDEAAGELSGMSPYEGRYRPLTPLSVLDGLQTAQSWEMRIDTSGSNTSFSGHWSITLTYAGCVPDQDGDGLADGDDRCPTLAADTASGCPATTRTLTAKYRSGAFRGALSSPVTGCEAGRSVLVWKVRKGPDRKIGTATTGADGGYRLTRAKRAGKYYATSPRGVVADVAECPKVTSERFRIG